MRTITRIILHCSASLAGVDLRASDIRAYHTNPVSQGGRGWKNPGYHYVVELSGKVVQILPESCIANGVKGYNQESIHICYVGGLRPHPIPPEGGRLKSPSVATPAPTRATTLSSSEVSKQLSPSGESVGGPVPANTMTPRQRAAIVRLLTDPHRRFPEATLHGHNEFAAKACPCFRVREEFPEFADWSAIK